MKLWKVDFIEVLRDRNAPAADEFPEPLGREKTLLIVGPDQVDNGGGIVWETAKELRRTADDRHDGTVVTNLYLTGLSVVAPVHAVTTAPTATTTATTATTATATEQKG